MIFPFKLKRLTVPLFWVSATWIAVNYGAGIAAKFKHPAAALNPRLVLGRKIDSSNENNGEAAPGGEKTEAPNQLPDLIKNPGMITEYVRELTEKTAAAAIEKGSSEVKQTQAEITQDLCQKIVEEIEKQCKIN